jgi:hypothetical protein
VNESCDVEGIDRDSRSLIVGKTHKHVADQLGLPLALGLDRQTAVASFAPVADMPRLETGRDVATLRFVGGVVCGRHGRSLRLSSGLANGETGTR